jgi:hypothetical protein
MGRTEAAAVLRAKREAILRGRYRPDPTRPVRIAKPSGGHRTLRLPTIADRVLYAALHDYLVPFWERFFLPRSHGFRPGRSRFTLLGEMDHEITATGRTVLVVDDVRRAFDTVRLVDCLAAHRRHLRDERLLGYIETALRGHDLRRTTGIDQGSPYSPTALNVLLNGSHDLPLDDWDGGQHPRWYRYADNLVYLTHHVTEGRDTRRLVEGHLRTTGMALKGSDDGITDINQGPVEVLGLVVRMADDRLVYAIPDAAWDHIQEALVECHWSSNPPEAARSAVRGWLEAQGPALENLTDATLTRLRRTGARNGFRAELPGPDTLREIAREAHRRWAALRNRTRRQTHTTGDGTGTSNPWRSQ